MADRRAEPSRVARRGEQESDPAKEGGWWCYGHCQRFVELNQDRERDVCGRCGRACVTWKPPAVQGALRIEGRRLSPEEAHDWFERMRAEAARGAGGGEGQPQMDADKRR